MAYNPKSDINEVAYWKREYNNYKRKNDASGMQFAQDSAKKYYDNLVLNGYGTEANYLKGADEKSAFDYSKSYGVNNDKANAYYDSYVDTYKKNVDSVQNSAISAANSQYEAGKLAVDNSYKDAAKAYYNQYLKEKKALPQQLAALGITGGAAESSLIELGNNYLSNLNQAQIQKNQRREKSFRFCSYNNKASSIASCICPGSICSLVHIFTKSFAFCSSRKTSGK